MSVLLNVKHGPPERKSVRVTRALCTSCQSIGRQWPLPAITVENPSSGPRLSQGSRATRQTPQRRAARPRPLRSPRQALLRLGLGGHANEDGDLGADLTVEVDVDHVRTCGLDGATGGDALAIDLDAELILDRIRDLSGGNGTEELVVLAHLGVDGDGLAVELGLRRVGIGDALLLALLDVVAALLKLLDVARGGRLSDPLGEQIVLRIAPERPLRCRPRRPCP